MIKRTFFSLFVCLSALLHAQTIVPKAGLTLSKMDLEVVPDENPSFKLKPGLSLGVGYNLTLSEKFSFQGEILFVQTGFDARDRYFFDDGDGTVQETNFKRTTTINYLQIPLLIRLNLNEGGKFYLNLGPSIGYGMGGKNSYSYSGYFMQSGGPITNYSESYKGKVKFEEQPSGYEGYDLFVDNKIDIQLQVGGGMLLMDKLQLDVRYGLGITDMLDGATSKHRVLQLTVGVPLRL